MVGLFVGAPVLRLRGDYLAIVTLGFGEIAREIFQSEWAAPVTGGAQGIISDRRRRCRFDPRPAVASTTRS